MSGAAQSFPVYAPAQNRQEESQAQDRIMPKSPLIGKFQCCDTSSCVRTWTDVQYTILLGICTGRTGSLCHSNLLSDAIHSPSGSFASRAARYVFDRFVGTDTDSEIPRGLP